MPSASRAALWSLGTHLQVAATTAQAHGVFSVDSRVAKAEACPEQCAVLEDFSTGWEGGCYGLQQFKMDTKEECRQNCCSDPHCEVWQFSYTGCWRGKGHYCRDGYGFKKRPDNLRLIAAQRIVHGTIEVVKKLKSHCLGLKRNVFYSNMSLETLKNRCRLKCYSDTSCGVWQVVHDKCYYGAGYVCSDYETAPQIYDGERIEHKCPGKGTVGQIAESSLYIVSGTALVLLIVLMSLACARRVSKQKGERRYNETDRDTEISSRLASIDDSEDGIDDDSSPHISRQPLMPSACSDIRIAQVQPDLVAYSTRQPTFVQPISRVSTRLSEARLV